ncbi:MAG: FHA domain-containing protein [Anaerolineales bacterium]|nr:FHA domain-containing protein [Anaerolineales bacterium]MCX7609086.1 FHA domain-containing protein [Anaerolineales bacterium]MDW8226825.1 DUF3662 domain-containing protein [Anaerolineales bacterium]
MNTLDELENRLKTFIEQHLVKYLSGQTAQEEIAHLLAKAMYNGLVKRGSLIKAPNFFTISAHPITIAQWTKDPRLLEELANALYETGTAAGYRFTNRIKITTVPDSSLTPGQIKVSASIRTGPLVETRGVPAVSQSEEDKQDAILPNAFFILHGTKIIPLTQPVINIGRRLENHIILDDPRVSRAHAQVRFIKGQFVIFDLDSTGGTYVNGKRITQTVLYPGDVVSLAGVTLIFGQDLPASRLIEEATEPGHAKTSERPTAHLPPPDQEPR